MKQLIRVALLLGFVATLAVETFPGSAARTEAPAADREVLLQLDREFDQATAEKGIEAWLAYFAANGSMLPENGPPITGHEAIRQTMSPAFGNPDFSLRWQPARADILIPNVLGVTVGRFERKTKNQQGKTTIQRGTYASIWRRQDDGSWKIVLDTGSPDGPPAVVD